ncbi:MAG: YfhO family protein [Cyanobacteria bacterium]|nr:YfhO family protein [Cyanobacteriota bacterium]
MLLKQFKSPQSQLQLPLLLLIAVWLLLWWPVLWWQQVLFIRDLTFYTLPMKHIWLEAILNGHLPEWTTQISCGFPFLAEPTHQTFYPLNVLFLFGYWLHFSIAESLSWFILLHSLGSFYAFYYLMRSGLKTTVGTSAWSAILFGCSGYVISITDNVNYLPSVVWLPLATAFWLEGLNIVSFRSSIRPLILCMLSVAMMIFAGDSVGPMIFLVVTILTTVHQTWRIGSNSLPVYFGKMLLTSVGTMLLSAVQLLPSWELWQLSVRQQPLSLDENTLFSFPPERLIELVQPFFYGSKYPSPHFIGQFLYPKFNEPWVDSIYIGLIPLIIGIGYFCFSGKTWQKNLISNTILWVLLGLICLFIAMGNRCPGFETIIQLLPPLQFQRYPEKWILGLTFSLCILSGLGFQSLQERLSYFNTSAISKVAIPHFIKVILALAVLFLGFILLLQLPAAIWIWPYSNYTSVDWGDHFFLNRTTHLQALAMHTGLVLALILPLFWVQKKWLKTAVIAIAWIAALDIFCVHLNHTPLVPRAFFESKQTPYALSAIQEKESEKNLTNTNNNSMRIFYDDTLEQPVYDKDPILLHQLALTLGLPTPEDAYPLFWPYKTQYQRDRLMFNSAVSNGIEYLNGRFTPLQLLSHRQMDSVMLAQNPARYMTLTGVNYVITTVQPHNPAWDNVNAFEEIAQNKTRNLRILRVASHLDKATIITHPIYNQDPVNIYKVLTTEFNSPFQQAEIHTKAAELPSLIQPNQTESNSVSNIIFEETPGHITIQLNQPVKQGQYLLVNESYYPGWAAVETTQNKQKPVILANHRFMAIPLEAGDHNIELRFHNQFLPTGILISLLTLAGFLGLMVFSMRKTQQEN